MSSIQPPELEADLPQNSNYLKFINNNYDKTELPVILKYYFIFQLTIYIFLVLTFAPYLISVFSVNSVFAITLNLLLYGLIIIQTAIIYGLYKRKKWAWYTFIGFGVLDFLIFLTQINNLWLTQQHALLAVLLLRYMFIAYFLTPDIRQKYNINSNPMPDKVWEKT